MSTHRYLDIAGLSSLWQKIKNLTSKKTSGLLYGEVDSTSTSTIFTARVNGLDSLYDGACVYLKNGVITSASDWTLNINNLGAKPVYQSQAVASRTTTQFNIAYTALFIYNSSRIEGGCWDYFYGFNSDNNTIAYQIRGNSNVNIMSEQLTRYKICFTKIDGTIIPSTTVSNSTGTSKTLTTESFNPYGLIYYYSTTTTVEEGDSPSVSYMWTQYPTVDLRYSFNTGTTLILKNPIYIRCLPQVSGSFKLASNDCIVQSLPSAKDDYCYLYLGKAYDDHRITLDLYHPIYYYDDGIKLWTGKYPNATESQSGLMSAEDKIKLNNLTGTVVASTTQPINQAVGDIWLVLQSFEN